jgi:hypothetical protein
VQRNLSSDFYISGAVELLCCIGVGYSIVVLNVTEMGSVADVLCNSVKDQNLLQRISATLVPDKVASSCGDL